jgi:flavodoxin
VSVEVPGPRDHARSLVVFDSTFGNTEVVARAVAEALSTAGPVRTLRVAEVEPGHLDDISLLVVGSPTHTFRPSPGIVAWLARLPPGRLEGVLVAAFDTRRDPAAGNPVTALLAGRLPSAAALVEGRLLRAGGARAGTAAGFVVEARVGPLRRGETDRARAWARALRERPPTEG